jgi:hypothetical protein
MESKGSLLCLHEQTIEPYAGADGPSPQPENLPTLRSILMFFHIYFDLFHIGILIKTV